ncbi:MAG: pyruvate kinase, partial [Candidatus Paceibacterota bacterium]
SVKLSRRDSDFVKLMAELNIDSMAVSFVQSGKDILEVKKLFPKGYAPHVVAKIETLAGVKNIDEILKEADGIMVARGDLGFAVPMEELPLIQKQLIKLGMAHSKPVIVATQMLESMTNSHLPTRAEISDVANAILDRTDAVMLSGETARGKYPVEAVKVMTKIINRMTDSIEPAEFKESKRVSDAMSASAVKIADQVGAKLIIVFSETGASARRVSRHRNSQPIIALSPNKLTIHKLNFSWGVRAYFGPRVESFKAALPQAIKLAKDNPIMKLSKGEPFVICAGLSFGKAGTTNMVLVERV